MMKPVINTEYQ